MELHGGGQCTQQKTDNDELRSVEDNEDYSHPLLSHEQKEMAERLHTLLASVEQGGSAPKDYSACFNVEESPMRKKLITKMTGTWCANWQQV